VQAGATFGGTDQHFADSVAKDAIRMGDETSLKIWLKAGWRAA